ncbi:MAG: peptide deformylase [Chloroflexota bacterium]|nr:MAG: peptide deformylase [Chloroflexota bacterium]
MSILPIRTYDDPILRRKASRVKRVDASVEKLVADMIETMHAAPGVGLAAPQVGVPLRLIVVEPPDEPLIVLVNPEIVRASKEYEVEEGCLSVPGYVGTLRRFQQVVVKGRDLAGKEVRIKADDFLAEVFQHEIDHVNGILYIDRLDSPDKLRKLRPSEVQQEELAE